MVHACQMQKTMQHQYSDLINAAMSESQGLRLGAIYRNCHFTQRSRGVGCGKGQNVRGVIVC
jgi:hypothetical protein